MPEIFEIPTLSTGAIPRFMSGEFIDCPVLQVLGAECSTQSETERILLWLSDGEYYNSYVMMVPQLNSMFHERKLQEFTIIRVDKYMLSHLNEHKIGVLLIMEMSVLIPGEQVATKIGEPIPFQVRPSFGDTNSLLPSLTIGVLPRLMLRRHIDRPVLQILGAKLLKGGSADRLRVLVSDGKYFNSYAMLATQLNAMYHEGKFQERTIIRVDNYIISRVERNDKSFQRPVLIIIELTVLMLGEKVMTRIGDRPTNYVESSEFTQGTISMANFPLESTTDGEPLPKLSTDVLVPMMLGKEIKRPVLQILGAKLIKYDNTERVRLHISDGKYYNSYAMLSTNLNSMYHEGKFQERTIFILDKYVTCAFSKTDSRVLLIGLKITILMPGDKVIKKIGQPCNYLESPEFNRKTIVPQLSTGSTSVVPIETNEPLPKLSTGALVPIMLSKEIRRPVLQIIASKIINHGDHSRVRLFISDGQYFNVYAMVTTTLNSMYHEGKLEELTIVRLDRYTITYLQCKPILIITEITVLMPGNKVMKRIGEPTSYQESPEFKQGTRFTLATINPSEPLPELSTGVLVPIMLGQEIKRPVLQILAAKLITTHKPEIVQLLVSDGKYFDCSAMLSHQLTSMYHEGKLAERTIVRVDDYITSSVEHRNRLVFVIMKLTVLVSGEKVLQQIGEPTNFKESTEFKQQIELTTGFTASITANETIAKTKPVLQIFACKQTQKHIYISLSDGTYFCKNWILDKELEYMFYENKLTDKTIIRVEDYIIDTLPNRNTMPVLKIMAMVILIPGELFNRIIGKPVYYEPKISTIPELSQGDLWLMLNGFGAENSVLHVLDVKCVTIGYSERTLLLLTDGNSCNNCSMLDNNINASIKQNLTKNTTIMVKKYTRTRVSLDNNEIKIGLLISDLTILGKQTKSFGQLIDADKNKFPIVTHIHYDPQSFGSYDLNVPNTTIVRHYNINQKNNELLASRTYKKKPKIIIKYKYHINLKSMLNKALTYAVGYGGGPKSNNEKWMLIIILLFIYSLQKQTNNKPKQYK